MATAKAPKSTAKPATPDTEAPKDMPEEDRPMTFWEHLDELRKLLGAGGPCGKQIEFLLQETHREINTIGSKVNQLEITRLVVEAKGEVERLREQVQNVE